jgi:hypothetical protein
MCFCVIQAWAGELAPQHQGGSKAADQGHNYEVDSAKAVGGKLLLCC